MNSLDEISIKALKEIEEPVNRALRVGRKVTCVPVIGLDPEEWKADITDVEMMDRALWGYAAKRAFAELVEPSIDAREALKGHGTTHSVFDGPGDSRRLKFMDVDIKIDGKDFGKAKNVAIKEFSYQEYRPDIAIHGSGPRTKIRNWLIKRAVSQRAKDYQQVLIRYSDYDGSLLLCHFWGHKLRFGEVYATTEWSVGYLLETTWLGRIYLRICHKNTSGRKMRL